jgi:hypothetical protein
LKRCAKFPISLPLFSYLISSIFFENKTTQVFPLASLRIFSMHELKALICGLQDDSENWLPHGSFYFLSYILFILFVILFIQHTLNII